MSRANVEIKTKDGACRTAVFRPASGAGPWPAVIFYMDGVAIRPTLYDMCQRLADFGYLVLLPDMFYRIGVYEPFEGKAVFTDPVQREKLMSMVRSATNKQLATGDTGSFLAYLDSRPDVAKTKLGTVGFCMGGGMALTAAAYYPDRIGAAASFHGGNLASDQATSPHLLLGKIKAEVYVAIADNDHSYPPEMAERFEAALNAAGVKHRSDFYEGKLHGWMKPDMPVYDAPAAERGWRELFALYGRALT